MKERRANPMFVWTLVNWFRLAVSGHSNNLDEQLSPGGGKKSAGDTSERIGTVSAAAAAGDRLRCINWPWKWNVTARRFSRLGIAVTAARFSPADYRHILTDVSERFSIPDCDTGLENLRDAMLRSYWRSSEFSR